MEQYVLALDQGTTSSRAILFDHMGRQVAQRSQPLTQVYPRPGWVEHDPMEIWEGQLLAARQVIADAKVDARQIAVIGVTNQRETTVVWDKRTGLPIHNAIVWQCRRTAGYCDQLKAAGLAETVRQKTGLVIDAYFSGTKLNWLLDNVPKARERAEAGELLFGTIDSWLIWNLTGGQVHVTDYSNASRTMLFDIHRLQWDSELLRHLGIPEGMLPEVVESSRVYGETLPELFGYPIAVAGDAGDQQAALFGQACFQPGMAKNTYGTGSFLLMNTGHRPAHSLSGLLTTIAWGLGGKVEYALEGSVFITGAAVQWLRDELGIIQSAAETEVLANSLTDTGGVYLVPAFVGLGAPYWDQWARGTLVGLTRGTGRAHIARAALEAIAYQSRDVLDLMSSESATALQALRVDGGAVANNFLMQFQSDILQVPVDRPVLAETTALGAAYLAGLAVGYWQSCEQLADLWHMERRFTPEMPEDRRALLYEGWKRAVERSLTWA